jgi:nucleotide-binding universal stress UspA family protein
VAVLTALELAKRFGAKLTVLHANHVGHNLQPALLVWIAHEPRPITEVAAERAELEVCEFLASLGCSPGAADLDVVIADEEPARAILRYARTEDQDLIVMGTHGRSAALHLFVGSVAEKVVRHADCPVLTVPARRTAASSEDHAPVSARATELAERPI